MKGKRGLGNHIDNTPPSFPPFKGGAREVYFASDFHFGLPDEESSREREQRVIRWLDSIKDSADTIFLLGDLFDFWHEYKSVVPKGNVRFLGKLAELSDAGIQIELFTGNHDLWVNDYFQKELNIQVHKNPKEYIINGKSFFIGHGDGLGPSDGFYKFLRKVFHHPIAQTLFRWIHPDIGMRIANYWSRNSRNAHKEPEEFLGEEKEWLIVYCKEKLKEKHYDYFVFGHRHLPIDIELNEAGSRYINLGEWISQNHYAVFNGEELALHKFEN